MILLLIACYWVLVSWTAGLLMYEDLRGTQPVGDTLFYIATRPIMWIVTPLAYIYDHTLKTSRRFRY